MTPSAWERVRLPMQRAGSLRRLPVLVRWTMLFSTLVSGPASGGDRLSAERTVVATFAQPVQGVAWSPDGRLLAAMQDLGSDTEVMDRNGSMVASLSALQLFTRPDIEFLDNRHVVTAPAVGSSPDAMLDVWALDRQRPVRTVIGPKPGGGQILNRPSSFCLSHDGSRLVVLVSNASEYQSLSLIDTRTWTMKSLDMSRLRDKAITATAVGCSGDGRKTAVGLINGVVTVLDNATLVKSDEFRAYAAGLQTGIGAVAFNEDGTLIAVGPTAHPDHAAPTVSTGPEDQRSSGLKLWRTADHRLLWNDQDVSPTRQINWSPRADALVVARDASVEIERAGGQGRPDVTHFHGGTTARFSADGSLVSFGVGKQLVLLHRSIE